MKIGKTHTKFLLQLVFSVVVIIISIKPIIELSNLLADNSDSIEMLEDIDGEEEVETKFDEYLSLTNPFTCNTQFESQRKLKFDNYSNQITFFYSDIFLPPPQT